MAMNSNKIRELDLQKTQSSENEVPAILNTYQLL